MARVKNGELDLLNDLYDRYGKRLYNYFLKATLDGMASDDLTQDLFIRVMKYRKSYKEGQQVKFWVFQIARNMVKDHFGKMKVKKDDYVEVSAISESLMEQEEDSSREQLLYKAMALLPDDKRELLVLSKFEKTKYEELAALRQITVANIKVQVHRAIKELKEHYFKLEADEQG